MIKERKPICVIGFPAHINIQHISDFMGSETVRELKEDYHVLGIPIGVSEGRVTVEVIFDKDIKDVRLEELIEESKKFYKE